MIYVTLTWPATEGGIGTQDAYKKKEDALNRYFSLKDVLMGTDFLRVVPVETDLTPDRWIAEELDAALESLEGEHDYLVQSHPEVTDFPEMVAAWERSTKV